MAVLGRVDIAVLAMHLDPRGGDHRREIELAEQRAEAHQLVVVEALAAKAQYQMVGPGLVDRRQRRRRLLAGQVDSLDISAERRPGRPHGYGRSFQDCCHVTFLHWQFNLGRPSLIAAVSCLSARPRPARLVPGIHALTGGIARRGWPGRARPGRNYRHSAVAAAARKLTNPLLSPLSRSPPPFDLSRGRARRSGCRRAGAAAWSKSRRRRCSNRPRRH